MLTRAASLTCSIHQQNCTTGEIISSVLLRGWKYPASGSHQFGHLYTADNLAIRRDKTGQHSLRRAADAINHVTAHCSRTVAQIVCCAAHRTAFFSVLPGKPVALLTCRSTNQLALCTVARPQCVHSDRQHSIRCWSYNPPSVARHRQSLLSILRACYSP